jgi:hypothetical protein
MDDERVHKFWLQDDREGYIAEAQRVLRLAKGGIVTPNVASRWFNLNKIFHATAGDFWIHREKENLWWTTSLASEAVFDVRKDPMPTHGSENIYFYRKACTGWLDKDQHGRMLSWAGLHPKARDFLFTEGTYQQLSADNAEYACALIRGEDLSPWHNRLEWRRKEERSKKGAVTVADARKRTAVRMADTAWATAAASGNTVVSIRKDKQFGFTSKREMEDFLEQLLEEFGRKCALTGLDLVMDGEEGDSEMRASLDRIDSSGHYEPANLQVVCRFINRWKSDSKNDSFIRLLTIVRGVEPS